MDALRKKIRQLETASHMSEWLSSPPACKLRHDPARSSPTVNIVPTELNHMAFHPSYRMDNLELLTKIQERIFECRRAATEAQDSVALLLSAWLMRLKQRRAKLT
jgi:hypothetical protein